MASIKRAVAMKRKQKLAVLQKMQEFPVLEELLAPAAMDLVTGFHQETNEFELSPQEGLSILHQSQEFRLWFLDKWVVELRHFPEGWRLWTTMPLCDCCRRLLSNNSPTVHIGPTARDFLGTNNPLVRDNGR